MSLILGLVMTIGCSNLNEDEKSVDEPTVQPVVAELQDEQREQARAFFGTLVDAKPVSNDTIQQVALGRRLYVDKGLSGNGEQSCESCHQLDKWGVDGEALSAGAFGKRVERNSPTTFNAWGHVAQFWDGRAATLEEQAKGPILAAGEMGMPSVEAVLEYLNADPTYPAEFRDAYGEVSWDNLAKAIAAFERTLVTHDRFDDWQEGRFDLTAQELRGYNLFVSQGCVGCHSGALLGGNGYRKLGLFGDYPGNTVHLDLGRFGVTGLESDKGVFKVPSLRNVGQTGPWFHDGGVEALEEAVVLMGELQLGRDFSKEEVSDIVSFLRVLDAQ